MTLYKNVTSQYLVVYAHNTSTDAPQTGDAANITCYLSKDAGAAAQTNDVNPTELDATNLKGLYAFTLLQAETNADILAFSPASTTGNVKIEPVVIYTELPFTVSSAALISVTNYQTRSTANVYDLGDAVTLTATFTSAPTSVIIKVKKPDGTIITYVYGLTSQGNWNATTNTPALADGTGTAGHFYTCNVAGTQTFGDESLTFAVGDRIYYNGYVWRRLTNVSTTGLTQASTLIYTVVQFLTSAGVWWYGVDSAGAVGAAEEYFTVRQQQVE